MSATRDTGLEECIRRLGARLSKPRTPSAIRTTAVTCRRAISRSGIGCRCNGQQPAEAVQFCHALQIEPPHTKARIRNSRHGAPNMHAMLPSQNRQKQDRSFDKWNSYRIDNGMSPLHGATSNTCEATRQTVRRPRPARPRRRRRSSGKTWSSATGRLLGRLGAPAPAAHLDGQPGPGVLGPGAGTG